MPQATTDRAIPRPILGEERVLLRHPLVPEVDGGLVTPVPGDAASAGLGVVRLHPRAGIDGGAGASAGWHRRPRRSRRSCRWAHRWIPHARGPPRPAAGNVTGVPARAGSQHARRHKVRPTRRTTPTTRRRQCARPPRPRWLGEAHRRTWTCRCRIGRRRPAGRGVLGVATGAGQQGPSDHRHRDAAPRLGHGLAARAWWIMPPPARAVRQGRRRPGSRPARTCRTAGRCRPSRRRC